MSRYDDFDYSYEDAYDFDAPRRKTAYCKGWADYSGPCGATDCGSCYPGYEEEECDCDPYFPECTCGEEE